MTDQTIPADKVRAWVTAWETTRPEHRTLEDAEGIIQALRDLLPPPPRPTLADMTDEERDECRWMQCDIEGQGGAWMIVAPFDDDDEDYAHVVCRWGSKSWGFPAERITPRPDLPRMEWPGTEKDEDANTVRVGDVIESATDPRLDALPAGTVLVDCDGETVAKRSEEWAGLGYIPIPDEGGEFGPWTVRRIGWENG